MKKLSNVWLYAVIFTLVVGFSSCSKDKDETVADPTTVLTTGSWKVADNGFKPLSGDLSSQLTASVKGLEFLMFNYKFESGGVLKLDFSGLGTTTGSWTLGADKKTLTMKDDQQTAMTPVEITEAKTGSMKWKIVYTKAALGGATSDVTIEITLVPKS